MTDLRVKQLFPIDSFEKYPSILLVGMPGIANVGKNVTDHLISQLKMSHYLEIIYADFPSKAIIIDEGVVNLPGAEVFHLLVDLHKDSIILESILESIQIHIHDGFGDKLKSLNTDKINLFALTGEFQPRTNESTFEFCSKICDLICEPNSFLKNVVLIIGLGAFISDKFEEETKIYITSTSKADIDRYRKLKIKKSLKKDILREILTLEKGVIVQGTNVLVPTLIQPQYNISNLTLLINSVPIPMVKKDPNAIKITLTFLDALLNLNLDYHEIEEDIKNFGINIQNLTSKKSTLKKSDNVEDNMESTRSYIG
jgi:proteasome assembly chaperone (PAC2) family protein